MSAEQSPTTLTTPEWLNLASEPLLSESYVPVAPFTNMV